MITLLDELRIWCLVFGVWCFVFGLRHPVFTKHETPNTKHETRNTKPLAVFFKVCFPSRKVPLDSFPNAVIRPPFLFQIMDRRATISQARGKRLTMMSSPE